MAFQCLALQAHQIQRNSGRLALIKAAARGKILIPSNHTMSITGYVDKKISLNNCYAVMQPTDKSSLPDNIEIVPAFVAMDAIWTRILPLSSQTTIVTPL